MSGTLYWEPAERKKKTLPTALKWALAKRYGDGGSVNMTMGEADRDYVQGLADAGVEGAQDLLDAIEKHGDVQLTTEY